MASLSNREKGEYGIGAVSKITGISAHTLRVWERRYGVVQVARTETGRRMFSHDDLQRLVLIKALVDTGNAISTVASLSLEQLEERVKTGAQAGMRTLQDEDLALSLAVFSASLPTDGQKLEQMPGISLVLKTNDADAFEAKIADADVDCLVLEFPTVYPETQSEVNRLLALSGARSAVVLYDFGTNASVNRLNSDRITAVRSPIDVSVLLTLCRAVSQLPPLLPQVVHSIPVSPDAKPRFFSSSDLSKIAAAATLVKCECPHHLVSIIFKMDAFEDYCLQCESRNIEDARLHAALHRITSEARAMMEAALRDVATADGLL